MTDDVHGRKRGRAVSPAGTSITRPTNAEQGKLHDVMVTMFNRGMAGRYWSAKEIITRADEPMTKALRAAVPDLTPRALGKYLGANINKEYAGLRFHKSWGATPFCLSGQLMQTSENDRRT